VEHVLKFRLKAQHKGGHNTKEVDVVLIIHTLDVRTYELQIIVVDSALIISSKEMKDDFQLQKISCLFCNKMIRGIGLNGQQSRPIMHFAVITFILSLCLHAVQLRIANDVLSKLSWSIRKSINQFVNCVVWCIVCHCIQQFITKKNESTNASKIPVYVIKQGSDSGSYQNDNCLQSQLSIKEQVLLAMPSWWCPKRKVRGNCRIQFWQIFQDRLQP